MRGLFGMVAAASVACVGLSAGTARAAASEDFSPRIEPPTGASELPYLQCVPYARRVSGIQIYGDAHTWWDQAEGKYARGTQPRVGAVMAFRPYGNMRLGHVAAVSRIIDSRTVLLRHANWSLIEGRRGQIEDDVEAVDVSPNNDWSEVRVWFAPIQGLGTTHWPLAGFIYPDKPQDLPLARTIVASTEVKRTRKSRIGRDFLDGIAPEPPAPRRQARQSADPIGDLIARVG